MILGVLSAFLAFIVFIVYFGYPIFLESIPRKPPLSPIKLNEGTVIYHILPMYNEEKVIERKILNSINLKSPFKIVNVLVIDKSDDKTTQIAKRLEKKNTPQLMVIDKGYRKGKNNSINQAIKLIRPRDFDILFFSDSNTMFEENILNYLCEELEKGYGLVGGSMKYVDELTGTAKSEGLYWKYEEWIRNNEAKIGRCLVVNGGNFAMFSKYFRVLPDFVPNDFEAPLRLCGQSIPVGFSKKAVGVEPSIGDEDEELLRKKRMANRQMNCIRYLWNSIDSKTKIHVTIRKIFRWQGFHLSLISLFLAIIYGFLYHQIIFLLIGTLGLSLIFLSEVLAFFRVRLKLTDFIHHAIVVHSVSFKGMVSSLSGKKVSTWNKAESNRS